jgi:hypothetical protein
MLGFKPKTDEQIKKDLEKKRLELDEMLRKSTMLKIFVNKPGTGWREFLGILDDYIDACKKRKAITAIDRADDKTIAELRLLDHEIYILSWVKNIPDQFINKTEEIQKNENLFNARDSQ